MTSLHPYLTAAFHEAVVYQGAQQMVYHYCSPETLLSILKSGNIRFGDSFSMNDGEEIAWALGQLDIAIQRVVDRDRIAEDVPALPKKFVERFYEFWAQERAESRQFYSCFSTDGDNLSQWRAYANDAQGYSIGFSVDETDVPAQVMRVIYDVDQQQNLLMSGIVALYSNNKDSWEYDNFKEAVSAFYTYMAAFKNPAFVDEKEIRFSHTVDVKVDHNGNESLTYIGGFVNGVKVVQGKVDFRVAKMKIVPFLDLPFKLNDPCPVKEIWMGPKCENSEGELKVLLGSLNYEGIAVKVAGNKYR